MQPLALMMTMPSGDTAPANGARTAGGNPQADKGFSALVEGAVAGTAIAGQSPTPQGEMLPAVSQGGDGTVMAGLMQALGLAPVTPAHTPVILPTGIVGAAATQAGAATGGATAMAPDMPVNGSLTGQPVIPNIQAPPGTVSTAAAAAADAQMVGSDSPALTANPQGAVSPVVTAALAGEVVAPVVATLAAAQAVAAGTVPAPVPAPSGASAPVPAAHGRGARPRFDAVNNAATGPAQAAPVRPAAFSLKGASEGMTGEGVTTGDAGGLSSLPGGTNPAASDPSLALTPAGQVLPGRDSAAAHAISAPRFAGAPLAPAQQLVARIEQAVSNGQTTLTVHMDPDHLGRVEVKLEMKDGKVTALISAERPATLDMLLRDARMIERAMEQGGMQVQPDGLQFSLRDGSGGPWAEAGQGRRGTRLYGQQAEADLATNPLSPPSVASDSLVDIHI